MAPDVFDAIDGAAEGFLVTDSNLRVEYANRKFLKMAMIDSRDGVRGQSLTRWIRFSPVQLAELALQLSDRRAVEEFTAALSSAHHTRRAVQVSAVALPDSKTVSWAFCLRELSHLH